jgi:hypothetical protein
MANNILIPFALLKRINDLLDFWDIAKYDQAVKDDYYAVKRELDAKLLKIELRAAYSKILRAKDEDARHSARMEYLWQKNYIGEKF